MPTRAALLLLCGCATASATGPSASETRDPALSAHDAALPSAARTDEGDFAIESYGASAEDIAGAVAVLRQVVARDDIARELAFHRLTLVLVPRGWKLVELPAFSALKEQASPDGEGYGNAVGVCCVERGEAKLAAIPEHDVAVGVHELGHAVLSYGLGLREWAAASDAYDARKAAGGPWTCPYASTNRDEYFAEATVSWFGRGERDAGWLREHDPALAALLQAIYGTPPLERRWAKGASK